VNILLDELAGPINEEQKNLLITSKENIDRLNRIINDLLDISKIESGKIDIKLGISDIVRVTKDLVNSHQSVVASKNIQLVSKFSDDSIFLHMDQDKIIQCFNNLLNNAFKFTPDGGRIEVTITGGEEEIQCAVKDSGRGITKDDMKKLFGKFQQFGRTDGAGIKGTGLGLTITKSLIELHGGRCFLLK